MANHVSNNESWWVIWPSRITLCPLFSMLPRSMRLLRRKEKRKTAFIDRPVFCAAGKNCTVATCKILSTKTRPHIRPRLTVLLQFNVETNAYLMPIGWRNVDKTTGERCAHSTGERLAKAKRNRVGHMINCCCRRAVLIFYSIHPSDRSTGRRQVKLPHDWLKAPQK